MVSPWCKLTRYSHTWSFTPELLFCYKGNPYVLNMTLLLLISNNAYTRALHTLRIRSLTFGLAFSLETSLPTFMHGIVPAHTSREVLPKRSSLLAKRLALILTITVKPHLCKFWRMSSRCLVDTTSAASVRCPYHIYHMAHTEERLSAYKLEFSLYHYFAIPSGVFLLTFL